MLLAGKLARYLEGRAAQRQRAALRAAELAVRQVRRKQLQAAERKEKRARRREFEASIERVRKSDLFSDDRIECDCEKCLYCVEYQRFLKRRAWN